jgi:hypothetical protein
MANGGIGPSMSEVRRDNNFSQYRSASIASLLHDAGGLPRSERFPFHNITGTAARSLACAAHGVPPWRESRSFGRIFYVITRSDPVKFRGTMSRV